MKNKFAIGAYFLKILSCVYCGTLRVCVCAGQLKLCNNIAKHEHEPAHKHTHTDAQPEIYIGQQTDSILPEVAGSREGWGRGGVELVHPSKW